MTASNSLSTIRAAAPATSLLTLLALVACGGPDGSPVPPDPRDEAFELARFESCTDLRDYAADAYVELLVQSYYGFGYDVALEDGTSTPGSGDESRGDESPSDWSDTNVQEDGVDEPDLVKTDGERLFVAEGQELHVLRSWPADQTELLASVDVGGWISSLLLDGNVLAVFSTSWDEVKEGWGWSSGTTRVTLIDVSDPAAPAVVREIELEGSYVDARQIDSDLYLVTNTWNDLPSGLWEAVEDAARHLPEIDWDDPQALRQARMEARARFNGPVDAFVAGMELEELLPMVRDSAGDGTDRLLLDCTDVYRPYHVSRPSTLSIFHLDLSAGAGGSALSATGLMADGWTVYASRANLYVSQTSQAWWWNSEEAPTMTTRIHQFALEGAETVYRGSGRVEGWLLNEWSMSEHEGSLRVATTDFGWGGDGRSGAEPANNVFVLQPAEDGHLGVVGEVRGIAPNEQIYTARFMGSYGFLVTFRQMDPLFTLDLSDPTAPAVVGELEVPGYSSYLHPVGEDRLLAVGMDGTEDGQLTGFQVSLYDVSDLAHPERAAMLRLDEGEWSDSEALWDHHAFTFHRGVLSVPVTTSGYDEQTDEWTGFSGLWVVDVDTSADTLTELGRIDHSDLMAQSECPDEGYGGGYGGYVDSETDTGGTGEGDCHDWQWFATMRRSVAIEDNLYSVSNVGVKVNDLHAPEVEHAEVVFHPLEGAE